MKALVCERLSDDLSGVSLKDLPTPEAGPGEVLLAVKAASLNYPDLLMTKGEYQFKPDLPFTLGMDVAGEVIATGEGVAGLAIGDRVCGGTKTGAFASHAVVPEAALRLIPERMGYAQAAAYGAVYLTAYVALVRRANLQPGETLLVHGAAGGTGMAAVDVGRILGATVIATSASDEKLAAVKAYGADHVINYASGFREEVKALTEGRGADVIFDPIGGDVFDESTRCIAFDGRLLVIGFTSGRIADVRTNIPLIKGFSVVGVRAGEYGRRFPERGQENLAAIWDWAASGKASPHIHAELPLTQAKDAFAMMASRDVVGKVILVP